MSAAATSAGGGLQRDLLTGSRAHVFWGNFPALQNNQTPSIISPAVSTDAVSDEAK
jgi:hypothetical protein